MRHQVLLVKCDSLSSEEMSTHDFRVPSTIEVGYALPCELAADLLDWADVLGCDLTVATEDGYAISVRKSSSLSFVSSALTSLLGTGCSTPLMNGTPDALHPWWSLGLGGFWPTTTVGGSRLTF